MGRLRVLDGPKIGKNMLRKNKGCFQIFGLTNSNLKCCNIDDFD